MGIFSARVSLATLLLALFAVSSLGSEPDRRNDSFVHFMPSGPQRRLFVSGSGDDNHSGLSMKTPFRSLQKAADVSRPGDLIWVMDGIYTRPGPGDTVLYINRSGTPQRWIRYKAYPGHSPLIRVGKNWGGITVAGASYIEIDGFEVIGDRNKVSLEYALSQSENLNNPQTSGNGISVTDEDGRISHHVIISDCHVYNCCGGGIATERADYVRIERNIVHHNAYYSPYSQSGISMYLNANFDQRPDFKMVVRDNICYSNRNLVPSFYSGSSVEERSINDGNGIIIDDTRNIQGDPPNTPYRGSTLVERNLCYYNGGRGLLCYLSDRIYVSHNFSFMNNLTPRIDSEVLINGCSSVAMIFNEIVPRARHRALEVRDTQDFYYLDFHHQYHSECEND